MSAAPHRRDIGQQKRDEPFRSLCTGMSRPDRNAGALMDAHTSLDVITAKYRAARAVLADREAELLEVTGPCSDPECRLHRAHRGPHDIREVTSG